MNREYEQDRVRLKAHTPSHDLAIEAGQSSRTAVMRKADHATASGLVQRKASGAPALRADSAVQLKSAADVAESGFSGGGSEIPHRAAMEESFGVDFGHVRAHTDSAAVAANDTLSSHAYAMGNQVAFKSASPSPALVAHELTHVLQQTESPSYKSTDGSVDTSGEAEADAVEAAVSAGRPARSALSSVSGAGGLALKAIGRGPARKGGPALQVDGWSAGVGATAKRVEASGSITIVHRDIPIPIHPPLFAKITPNVKAELKGGIEHLGFHPFAHGLNPLNGEYLTSENTGDLKLEAGLTGAVDLGLQLGAPPVASAYIAATPALVGKAVYERKWETGYWSVAGEVEANASAKVGLAIFDGRGDFAITTPSFKLFTIKGIVYDNVNKWEAGKIQFEWGPAMQKLVTAMGKAIAKAQLAGGKAVDNLKTKSQKMSEKMRVWGQAAKANIKATKDSAKTMGNQAIKATKNTAKQFGNSAKELGGAVKQRVGATADAAMAKGSHVLEATKDKANQSLEDVLKRLEDWLAEPQPTAEAAPSAEPEPEPEVEPEAAAQLAPAPTSEVSSADAGTHVAPEAAAQLAPAPTSEVSSADTGTHAAMP